MFEIIDILFNREKLDEKDRDHELNGNYVDVREYYIEPDWLLIYEYIDNVLVLILYRLGTHSTLFN